MLGSTSGWAVTTTTKKKNREIYLTVLEAQDKVKRKKVRQAMQCMMESSAQDKEKFPFRGGICGLAWGA